MASSHDLILWLTIFFNYFASAVVQPYLSSYQRKKFMHDVKKFFLADPYFYRSCVDGIICRCVSKVMMLSILEAFH